MAEIKSFPNNQSTYVGAEWVMRWLHGRTSGVFAAENNAAVRAITGEMAVYVTDGIGWISNSKGNGVVWWNDADESSGSPLTLTIDTADGALDRIDRVIVEWKTTNYVDLPEIKILKGNRSSSAIPPELTNDNTVRQISIAQISIPAGTLSITSDLITDERLDNSVCGLVTDSISVDTSIIQAQMTALLNIIQQELDDINDGSGVVVSINGKSGVAVLNADDVGAPTIPLHITATLTTLPAVLTNPSITDSMRVVECVFGTPSAILSDVSWTTSAGEIALSGSMSGSTTVDIILIETT